MHSSINYNKQENRCKVKLKQGVNIPAFMGTQLLHLSKYNFRSAGRLKSPQKFRSTCMEILKVSSGKVQLRISKHWKSNSFCFRRLKSKVRSAYIFLNKQKLANSGNKVPFP